MAITPEGLPAWTRTASHTQYGGRLDKQNYQNTGCINAQTDVGAEHLCRMASDLAAVVRTAPFAVLRVLCDDTTPGAPIIESAYLMTGVRVTSYVGDSAPTGFPSAERNGDGDVTFTFDSSYDDEYGVSGGFAIGHVEVTAHNTAASPAYVATPEADGQTVRIRVVRGDDGSAVADARFTLVVY